jgi:hypothetical protein
MRAPNFEKMCRQTYLQARLRQRRPARSVARSTARSGHGHGTPSSPDAGHANRDVVHRVENLIWRRLGPDGGGYDDSTPDVPPMSRLNVLIVLAALSLPDVAAWMLIHGMILKWNAKM